jgi:hypothetical protein
MLRYGDVQRLLDESVGDEEIGAHGAFWRGLTRDEFVAKRVYGKALVRLGEGENSNLLLALRGRSPFGSDVGVPGATIPRMPARRAPLSDDDIALIAEWITNNCPE